MATDATLALALLLQTPTDASRSTSRRATNVVSALVLLNAGLLLVDHIHFQYNGFMLGLLGTSVMLFRRSDELTKPTFVLLGGACFACLLVLKHLYVFAAPLYFVYLLNGFCFGRGARQLAIASPSRADSSGGKAPAADGGRVFFFTFTTRLVNLGVVVIVVILLPLLPILHDRGSAHDPIEQLQQIFVRLFPFGSQEGCGDGDHAAAKMAAALEGEAATLSDMTTTNACHERGLVHAYWAANLWALYLFADRVLALASNKLGLGWAAATVAGAASPTSGLVQTVTTSVLPMVTPLASAVLTFGGMAPSLWSVARKVREGQKPITLSLDTFTRLPSLCS